MTDRDEPALPEPSYEVLELWGQNVNVYTADQLRTYAAEYSAPLRAEIERLTAALAAAHEVTYAEGRQDQREDDLRLLAWAYRKLMHCSFSNQEDALALDEINLMLMGAQ